MAYTNEELSLIVDNHSERLKKVESKQDEQSLIMRDVQNKVTNIDEIVTKLNDERDEKLKEDSKDKKEFLKKVFYIILSFIMGGVLGALGLYIFKK